MWLRHRALFRLSASDLKTGDGPRLTRCSPGARAASCGAVCNLTVICCDWSPVQVLTVATCHEEQRESKCCWSRQEVIPQWDWRCDSNLHLPFICPEELHFFVIISEYIYSDGEGLPNALLTDVAVTLLSSPSLHSSMLSSKRRVLWRKGP